MLAHDHSAGPQGATPAHLVGYWERSAVAGGGWHGPGGPLLSARWRAGPAGRPACSGPSLAARSGFQPRLPDNELLNLTTIHVYRTVYSAIVLWYTLCLSIRNSLKWNLENRLQIFEEKINYDQVKFPFSTASRITVLKRKKTILGQIWYFKKDTVNRNIEDERKIKTIEMELEV